MHQIPYCIIQRCSESHWFHIGDCSCQSRDKLYEMKAIFRNNNGRNSAVKCIQGAHNCIKPDF